MKLHPTSQLFNTMAMLREGKPHNLFPQHIQKQLDNVRINGVNKTYNAILSNCNKSSCN